MKMVTKTLKGLGKAFTTPNTIENGGLSALLVPRKVNAAGAGLIVGGSFFFNAGKEGVKGRNKAALGPVSYSGGPARMTQSFVSGSVQAMHDVSGGNYAAFSDMAGGVMAGSTVGGKIENYGATPELISALYNMGG